ncbi:SCP-like protein [Teladorsagia circumcincta]|uniref:SCP-like protein n=1 Tax=Teladorsagia circumcincta TaxID=45464 RepID=A0A2G9UFU9_TELCI|nr:SCP-like protein [Teladorsagia circumcincta]
MTDEARQMFLDKHNQYRSLVAKGQANNGQGGFAPKASRMSKMNYDCAAEASVMSWLTQCTLQPSPMSYRGLGLGENLWHADDKSIDKVKAANESTASWFGTLQSAGMFIGQDNTLGLNAYYLGAQYYAQMAWQKTLSLGCGVVPCSNMAIVGCHYKYATMLGGKIYEMGDPCTTDADCKCIGCVCSKDEALCLVPPQTESQNSYWKN